MKYYAVDVRNSCNSTSSATKKKYFPELFDFCIFCSNIFFLYFLVHGKLQKHSLLSLFFCPTSHFSAPSPVSKSCRRVHSTKYTFKDSYSFWKILLSSGALLPCLVSSDIYSYIPKAFPTRVLAFPKSYYFPCFLENGLAKNKLQRSRLTHLNKGRTIF